LTRKFLPQGLGDDVTAAKMFGDTNADIACGIANHLHLSYIFKGKLVLEL